MQDSLGGNSKTMIIANVSPSIWFVYLSIIVFLSLTVIKCHENEMDPYSFHFCSCAAETLNTLKFAQRAKLIQNNVSALL